MPVSLWPPVIACWLGHWSWFAGLAEEEEARTEVGRAKHWLAIQFRVTHRQYSQSFGCRGRIEVLRIRSGGVYYFAVSGSGGAVYLGTE